VAKHGPNLGLYPLWLLVLAVLACSARPTEAQTLSPTSIAFGNWVVQTTSTSKTVVLSNPQTVPLTIAGISTSGDFAQTSNCPLSPNTLAANLTCKIFLTFTPTALGGRSGTLTISDNAQNSPQTAQLSGTGLAPASLSPSSLALGSQVVNTTSAAKTLTLQNNQTAPLAIAAIATSGDFAESSNCPLSPNTLAAKLSCTISVTFTPTTVGARAGTLTVNDNVPNSPQVAQLTGTGTAPVTLSPTSLSFGSQVVTTTSPGKTVTLKNNQTVPLTLASISTSGSFTQTSTCPLSPNTLGAGASCSILILFTPSALGTRTGTLTLSDNAGNSPQTVALSGTGTLSGLLSISVSPANPTLTPGSQQQLAAGGTWPGGVNANISQFVSWSSSASSVVSISSTGLAKAGAQGVATITASSGSIAGSTAVTVATPVVTSITVLPAAPSVLVGASQQFTAILNYSDGSTRSTTQGVSWSSSASSVATVNNSGLASVLAAGNATITATLGTVIGSTTLSASQPQCTPTPPGLVGWWTGDEDTVDIAGSNSGTLQNGAMYGNGEVGQAFRFTGGGASVLVNSQVYSPSAGTLMLWFLPTSAGTLTGSYDGTNRTPGLAIDSNGNLSWEFGDLSAQVLGQVSFNQWSHVALTYSSSDSGVTVSVYLNGNLAASAIASQNSSWYPQVAFGAYLGAQKPSFAGLMDEIAIFNQALNAQQIQQSYSAFSTGMCKPALQTITIAPANLQLPAGVSQQFSATGNYTNSTTHDLTSSANWSSSNPGVAAINPSGLATTFANGSSSISAALGSISAVTGLTVSSATLVSITVNPPAPFIGLGTTQQFTATGTFTDSSTMDLTTSATWTSGDVAVATVNSGGLGTSVAIGPVAITATLGGISGSAQMTVTSASMVSIAVSPASAGIPLGQKQAFTAIGTFTDGSTQNVNNSVVWSSSSPTVATVSNTPGTSGLATGTGSGNSVISATSGAVSGSGSLTVNNAILAAIEVTPQGSFVPIGGTQQLTAVGLYSDGTSANITTTVVWSSSSPTVATVGNISGSLGLVTGLAAGTARIDASAGSIVSSATLTVQDPLVSISIAPTNPVIPAGTTQQFAATGIYASGVTNDVSSSALWTSSSSAVATIDSTGLAASVGGGQTVISASVGPVTASTTLTATITPVPTNFRADISVGTTGQLFVSWDTMKGATYYNLQRSTKSNSGYTKVSACSGLSNQKNTNTTSNMKACRDAGLTPGVSYYYEVQACYSSGCSSYSAAASNVPVTSDCTADQIPNTGPVQALPQIKVVSSTVDPAIQFLPNNYQYAFYAAPGVPRRNLLLVDLPGSDETCPGAAALNDTAQKLGFDVICVNYSNLASQQSICLGETDCFGNISQAKLDATGKCSNPGQSRCGIDPKTRQPYFLNNPADAVTQRISMMLQYLNANGYNQNGTNWGDYLAGTMPLWQNIVLAGHSQGGDMSTFAAYKYVVARAINLSGPPQATMVNKIEVGADYFTNPKATDIRNIYGLVSVSDLRYQQGIYAAVWQLLGFTAANNDAEVKLNTNTPIGLNCNSGIPSHNFSTSAPPGPDGNGHVAPLYLWNEDIYKFMLIE
jgi:trimeric autotransporter adhesin